MEGNIKERNGGIGDGKNEGRKACGLEQEKKTEWGGIGVNGNQEGVKKKIEWSVDRERR